MADATRPPAKKTAPAKTTPPRPEPEATTGIAKMREPFPTHQIAKLPKPVKKNDDDKGRCDARSAKYSADGYYCGGWHSRSIHLDYVGHAPLTDRLLDADPEWDWQPAYRDVNSQVLAAAASTGNPEIVRMVIENAPPLIDKDGGMWITLTVDGTTRLGYGDAQGKTGPNAVKERIGDALRNAGMRFGAALDLWHKGELHLDDDDPPPNGNGRPVRAVQHDNGKPKAGEQTAELPPDDTPRSEPTQDESAEPPAETLDEFKARVDAADTKETVGALMTELAKSQFSGRDRAFLRTALQDKLGALRRAAS